MIIAIAVGGVCFLVLIVVAAAWLYRKQSAKRVVLSIYSNDAYGMDVSDDADGGVDDFLEDIDA